MKCSFNINECVHSSCMAACAFLLVFNFAQWFQDFWSSNWNIFDFMLVFVSLLSDALRVLKGAAFLRIFRVMRAFRSMRSLSAFKGLQAVVNVITDALPDLGSICALLFIVCFIFAVSLTKASPRLVVHCLR